MLLTNVPLKSLVLTSAAVEAPAWGLVAELRCPCSELVERADAGGLAAG